MIPDDSPEPDTPNPAAPPSSPAAPEPMDLDELRESVNSLRTLFQVALAALILALASLNVFFFHQIRVLRIQSFELQANALEMKRLIGDYETNSVPLMDRFTTELSRFAERNPDFAPIMAKYARPASTNAPGSSPTPTSPPAVAPAPAQRR